MSNLQNLGPTGEPLGDILDAEFVEVSKLNASAEPHATPVSSQSELSELWRSIPTIPKVLIASLPMWLLVTCAWHAGTPGPAAANDMSPAQLAAATDMGAVVGGDAASGQTVYLDDLASSAPGDCGGKFIWAFNFDGTTDTVSLRDEDGTSVTSGKYMLLEKRLRLRDLVERRPGDASDTSDRHSKNKTYQVSRTGDGRIVIGKKTYRQCTLKTENAPPAPVPTAAPANPPSPQQNTPQAVAAAPPGAVTPDEACDQLSGELRGIIEGNSNGTLGVIEASAIKGRSSAQNDGTLSCYGSVITNRGTLFGHFGTTYTPKGQLLVTWNIDEITTNYANRGL